MEQELMEILNTNIKFHIKEFKNSENIEDAIEQEACLGCLRNLRKQFYEITEKED